MFKFVESFLQIRTFQVKGENCCSDKYIWENGVPQGSTLPVTLFLVCETMYLILSRHQYRQRYLPTTFIFLVKAKELKQ